MKRTAFLLLISKLSTGRALAGLTYIGVSASDQTFDAQGSAPMLSGNLDTFTSAFTQLSFLADTTTTQYGMNRTGISEVGDRFMDAGTPPTTDFLPAVRD